MPYRSVLGGSPLGLIGVRSAPNPVNGLATWNIDASRNTNVAKYNDSRGNTLFTGKKRLRAWPNLKATDPPKASEDGDDEMGLGKGTSRLEQEKSYQRSTLHADSVYDTSILNIIEKLANTKAALKPGDFAYLKNLGVFPNNRIVIIRRFLTAANDNIMIKTKGFPSVANLITWIPQDDDFLKLSFGEEWEDAEADFKGVLNSLGEDIGLGKLGGIAGAAGNITPLPGFTEIFQRQILEKLGVLDPPKADTDPETSELTSPDQTIPAGNPNLIKMAKARKTVGYGQAGSGLTCTCQITVKCEYELKYISGIDPTMVWMDIVANITRFGTSTSSDYGFSKKLGSKLTRWLNNPDNLITDLVKAIRESITGVVKAVKDQIKKIFEATTAANEAATENEGQDAEQDPNDAARAEKKLGDQLADKIGSLANKIGKSLLQKYRVKIIGIINALSGLPSTPWHITIGNPMRPVFCSGDMYTKSVSMTFGPHLAFNDLPSSITAEFTLENARPWGMQEIIAKFNSGYLRAVDVQKSYYETDVNANTDSLQPTGIIDGDESPPTATQTGTQSQPVTGTNTNNTGQNNTVPPGTPPPAPTPEQPGAPAPTPEQPGNTDPTGEQQTKSQPTATELPKDANTPVTIPDNIQPPTTGELTPPTGVPVELQSSTTDNFNFSVPPGPPPMPPI